MIKHLTRLVKNNALVRESLKKPFRFSIDIVDACNLRCVICPRGVYYKKSTASRMKLEVFERLLDKIVSECACQTIQLYNWTEPFLHPELDRFVAAVKRRGIGCIISSNLSFKNDALIEAVMAQAPALIISVSGFTQEVYELYHKGGKVEGVKENLKFIAGLRDRLDPRLQVEVHCLQFVDNERDQVLWMRFCEEHGFQFLAKPACISEVATPDNVQRLLWKPEFDETADGGFKVKEYLAKEPVYGPCGLHNEIPINYRCDAYLCCIYWNREEYRIGNYFDLGIKQIQQKRFSMRECSHCRALRQP